MKIFSPILKGTTTMSQGTTNLSGSFTGSLLGTAATASYADNFTVGGTLTAQRIVVQTISSSVEFASGSNIFGSLSTNTHQFTGSVGITGSAAALLNVNNGILYVSASGNVGINNVSPAYSLDVTGTARVTTSAYFATVSGSVGIGTTSPQTALDIINSGTYQLHIASSTASYSSGKIYFGGLGTGDPYYYGTIGWDQSDVTMRIGAQCGNATGGIAFYTSAGTSAQTEKMRITSAGNVGIGTSSPAAVLHVNGAALPMVVASTSATELYTEYRYNTSTVVGYIGNGTGVVSIASGSDFGVRAQNNLLFAAGGNNERMRILSAGNVLIGRTTLTGGTGTFEVEQNNTGGFTVVINSSNSIEPSIYLRNVGSATKGVINSNLDLAFQTNATERMRITTAGTVQITNAGSLSNSFQIYPTGNSITSGTTAVIQLNQSFAMQMDTISSVAYGVIGGDSALGGINFRTYSGGYAYRFFFYSNGTAYNSTGTWGNSSDIRLKQDIVDANSQWNDIKSLKFKKYRLKKDVQNELESTDGFTAPTHFGLIAQDVELTSPGLVEEVDGEDGNKTKMLKTSVMLMKSVKALQEAMAKIETLEADNNTLKEILQRNNIQ